MGDEHSQREGKSAGTEGREEVTETSGLADDQPETPGLADDQLYRALASRRRRRLLSFLLSQEQSDVKEIATILTGWESADDGRMVAPTERDRIRATLIHEHLPLLDETGLVSYEELSGSVSIAGLDEDVRDLIVQSVTAESESAR